MAYDKSLSELIYDMVDGAKVAHYDWELNEYIQIIEGEFYDETGDLFTLSPWMLNDSSFGILGGSRG